MAGSEGFLTKGEAPQWDRRGIRTQTKLNEGRRGRQTVDWRKAGNAAVHRNRAAPPSQPGFDAAFGRVHRRRKEHLSSWELEDAVVWCELAAFLDDGFCS